MKFLAILGDLLGDISAAIFVHNCGLPDHCGLAISKLGNCYIVLVVVLTDFDGPCRPFTFVEELLKDEKPPPSPPRDYPKLENPSKSPPMPPMPRMPPMPPPMPPKPPPMPPPNPLPIPDPSFPNMLLKKGSSSNSCLLKNDEKRLSASLVL